MPRRRQQFEVERALTVDRQQPQQMQGIGTLRKSNDAIDDQPINERSSAQAASRSRQPLIQKVSNAERLRPRRSAIASTRSSNRGAISNVSDVFRGLVTSGALDRFTPGPLPT
jgi:hypothetical protein